MSDAETAVSGFLSACQSANFGEALQYVQITEKSRNADGLEDRIYAILKILAASQNQDCGASERDCHSQSAPSYLRLLAQQWSEIGA